MASDVSEVKDDQEEISFVDTKTTKPQILEILMDVQSSTRFVDITSNILIQLGFPHNIATATKG